MEGSRYFEADSGSFHAGEPRREYPMFLLRALRVG
jgi:hypothetical protein